MRKVTATKRVLTIVMSAVFASYTAFGIRHAHANDSTTSKKRHTPISIGTCPTCAPALRALGSSPAWPATLGVRTQVTPLTPVVRSFGDGVPVNFVSTATGNLAFAMIDLSLPGVMPIMFQRTYSSGNSHDAGLGAGWSFAYDDRITVNGDSATLTANSSTIHFKRQSSGSHFVLAVDEPIAHQSFDLAGTGAISETIQGITRTYQKVGAAYRLATIADANGNAINISFDA